jgi:hypothetical protein
LDLGREDFEQTGAKRQSRDQKGHRIGVSVCRRIGGDVARQNSALRDLLFDLNSRTTRTMISGLKNKSPLSVREGVIELNGVPK